jgi:hypothetical protein
MKETWDSSSSLGDQSRKSPTTNTMKMKRMVALVVICAFLQVFAIPNSAGGFKSAEDLIVMKQAETPLSVSVDGNDGSVFPTALPEDNADGAESDGISSASNDQSSDESREKPESPYDVLNPSPPQKEPETTKSEGKVKVTDLSPLDKKSKITKTLAEKVKVSKPSTPSHTEKEAGDTTESESESEGKQGTYAESESAITSRNDPVTTPHFSGFNDSRPVLVILVGPPKTATTTLQST